MRIAGPLEFGEYIVTFLSYDNREIKSIWTEERWILEKDEQWMGGPYYRRGKHMYSFRNPELVIRLSEGAIEFLGGLSTLAGRPVYHDGWTVRDAVTDAPFDFDEYWRCEAGFIVNARGALYFTDGVRENISMGNRDWVEFVDFLRVSETEYSIRVGRSRYYLLDTAKWTCIRV